MAWEDAAARLGTRALVARLKALEGTMKKGQFKRLVATTAAQVLAVAGGVLGDQADLGEGADADVAIPAGIEPALPA